MRWPCIITINYLYAKATHRLVQRHINLFVDANRLNQQNKHLLIICWLICLQCAYFLFAALYQEFRLLNATNNFMITTIRFVPCSHYTHQTSLYFSLIKSWLARQKAIYNFPANSTCSEHFSHFLLFVCQCVTVYASLLVCLAEHRK